MQALLGRCSGCSSPRRAVRTYSQYLSRHLRARPRARPVWEAVWRFFAEIGVVAQAFERLVGLGRRRDRGRRAGLHWRRRAGLHW